MDFFNSVRNFFGGGGNGGGGFVPDNQLGGTTTNNQAYAGNNNAPLQPGNTGAYNVQPPQGVLGASASIGPGGQQSQQPQQPQQQQQPQGPSQDALGAIDSLYNSTLSQLGGIQSNLQGEQQSEVNQVQQGQQTTQKSLQAAQTGRQADITTRQGQARDQQTSALEQLRQVYGDAQSQQVAQLSAAGISSSSAAEALGVYLTRDQAQRVSGVVQQTGDVMSALSDEEKSVNDWYQQSTTELQADTQNKVDQINRDFASRVGQLDQIRGQSAVARQSQRADLFNQYQQQLSDMQNYASQAQYSLQQWQQQQGQNLSNARQQLGGINQTQVQNIAQQGGSASGLQLVGYDANGQPLYSGGKFAYNANNFGLGQNPNQGNSVIQPSQAGGAPLGTNNNSARFYQPG